MAPLWSVKKEVFKGNPGISSIMDKRLPKTARKCFLHSMYDILFKIVSITDWDWKWILQAICSFSGLVLYWKNFFKSCHSLISGAFWLIFRWISTWGLHCAIFLQYKVTFRKKQMSIHTVVKVRVKWHPRFSNRFYPLCFLNWLWHNGLINF